MKIIIIIILIALYVFIAWFMYQDGYKTGKEHGAADEKIRQKEEFKKAIENSRLFSQETYNIVPAQAAFELPLDTSSEETEKQRAWAYGKLADLIGEEIKQYIKFYDCENLPYCRRTYKAELKIVDERNRFIEKGSRHEEAK